ncbi:MAG: leucine-rich repeat domain-containing protein, partial [Lachnospiraceae bacterium]|nr:leucine-rich repeat domain-containing protein [Lachnospiraceae bacterium]
LKKIWSYRKREDGTLLITNYKGTDTEVTVPEKIGKGIVTGIGTGAFSGGYSNPKVTVEQVEQHMRITNIILPKTLQYIGENAFCKMPALKEIDIPEGVEKIDDYAFWKCESLKSITIPGTVKKIGNYVFEGCIRLEKVYINEGVLEIGAFVFSNCMLKEIRIPESVQNLSGTTKNIGTHWMFGYSHPPKMTVYCPKGSQAEEYCREMRISFRNSEND